MARPLWKGAISFGLVTIPIGLVSALEAGERLAFHLLHRKDGSRIAQKRFCQKEDVEVPWSEVVKGYEYTKGRYVVLTEEDFQKARVPGTQTFDIRAFVPAADVEDVYFDHPYYVAPQGRAALKAYALLRDVLRETGKLGIGTIVLRQREHLAALEPLDSALVLTTLRYAHEIRSPKDLDLPAGRGGGSERELALARQLVDSLSDTWDPREYRDTYDEVLRRLIAAKARGEEITAPEEPARPRVVDLASALRESLKAGRRPLARAGARRRPARRPARGRTAA
jgi:DNA end-binding protein Ku